MYFAFCFSCSWARYSLPALRRRVRPCWPGGEGRRSSAPRPFSFSKMLVARRRAARPLGPVYRAMGSGPATLGLTAAVVGDGGDVLDRRDLDAGALDAAHRGVTSGAGALD